VRQSAQVILAGGRSRARHHQRRRTRFRGSSATSSPVGLPLGASIRARFAAIVTRPRGFDFRIRLANSVQKMGGLEPRT